MKTWMIVPCLMLLPRMASAESLIQPGDRIAIVGDSITEQKLYSRFIEDYLLACTPELNVDVFQFGWSGERAPGFAWRMENDLVPWRPTLVTTCYGMNDGEYRPYEPSIGKAYEDGTRRIEDRMKALGARMIVGGPGAVDTQTWRWNEPDADQMYNDNLARLSDIAEAQAREHGFTFVDLHSLMMDVMQKAKAALGPGYPVCGGDGVHPQRNGHLVMAYAFLKAMGMDGQIGTITLDLDGGCTATGGHRVLSAAAGRVEIESDRYPFCFAGGPTDADGTRSILPFLPFNQDLNRFRLVVIHLPTESAGVTWGEETKTFTREQLAGGVNLAAEFIDNPFREAFRKVDDAVKAKQQFETRMIKGMVTSFDDLEASAPDDAELGTMFHALRDKLTTIQAQMQERARAQVQPVRHTLLVEPLAE